MFYHHLTIEERICISKMSRQGDSFREIARVLGRNPSTISREYHRNFNDQSDFGPDYYPILLSGFIKNERNFVIKQLHMFQMKSLNILKKNLMRLGHLNR